MQLVAWVTENLEDVESDMSAFHRVDDYVTVPAPLYFSRVARLGAYTGVVQARILQERENGNASTSTPASTPQAPQGNQHVDNDVALAMLADGWVERTETKEG